jgi:hypothetical protein
LNSPVQEIPIAKAEPSVTLLQQNVTALEQKIAVLEASISALNQTSAVQTKPMTVSNVTKKVTTPSDTSLFLGSGQTDNRDWVTLTSAAADVDLSSNLKIKEVRFEAGLGIIGGEAHARLIDMTTGDPIYDSEIYGNTDAGQWVSSGPLHLPIAKHNYAFNSNRPVAKWPT